VPAECRRVARKDLNMIRVEREEPKAGAAKRNSWICLVALMMLVVSPLMAQEQSWPKTLSFENGLLTIYPPQAEGMDADVLRYRAALGWRKSPDAEPVFGAGWFESTVDIDPAQGVVRPRDMQTTALRFPQGSNIDEQRLRLALAGQWTQWNLDFPLDQLEADLQTAAAEQQSLRHLNTAPPQIIYRDHPALLITLDGDPVLREIEGSPCKAVINTPYPMISDGGHFYLNVAEDIWYRADQATGPYRYQPAPPARVATLVNPDEIDYSAIQPAEPITAARAPEIVVTTRPAELVVTNGPAMFVPLTRDLLVLQNSDDSVFFEVEKQQYYIVLAGRWYHADTLNGPWSYQAAEQLPPAFADIPQDSEHADARVHVAGTAEADTAVLDAQLPHANAVARGPAEVEVAYDGEPAFQPVDGTELTYATNSGSAVLRSDRQYYLVEDGVWYVSSSPYGPWQVSAWRPESVGRILPSSPIYHVKYVYIYGSTPDYVYFGYTPGYFGSYVYHGTVVYGTGWYYRPWVSPHVYYPRPLTWGFHPRYMPWTGWSFSLSWNWGWDPFYPSYWAGGFWHHHQPWHHRNYSHWGPRSHRGTASPVRDHADRARQARRDVSAPPNEPALRARVRNRSGHAPHGLVVAEPGSKASRQTRRPLQLQSTAQPPGQQDTQRNERPRPRAGTVLAQQPAPSSNPALRARVGNPNGSAPHGLVVAEPGSKASRKSRPPPALQSTVQPSRQQDAQRNDHPRPLAGTVVAQQPAAPALLRRAKAIERITLPPRQGVNTGAISQRSIVPERQPSFTTSDKFSNRISQKRGARHQD